MTTGGNGEEQQGRRLFGVSLTDRPVWQQFLICSSGFFFGYLVNGICEVHVVNPSSLRPPPPSDYSLYSSVFVEFSQIRPIVV